MKRVLPFVLVVGGIGLVLWVVARSSGPRQPMSSPAAIAPTASSVEAAQPAATPPAAPASDDVEAVVYQFADETSMREFTGLWQQRQKALLRLAVVRAYFDNEQQAAAKLNEQLQTQYHLNPTSNYTLDAEQRQLIERPAPAAAAEAPAAEGQPAAPAGEEKVVHSFTNEDEMKTFANLWQQHQGSGVRMAVLKSFWEEDNAALTKLNETFTASYNLDTTKNYRLDVERRVLVTAPHIPPGAGALPNVSTTSEPVDQPPTP